VIYVLKHADGREVGRSRFPIQVRDGQWWSLDSLWLDPAPGDGSTVETWPDVPTSVTARQAVEALIRIGVTEAMVEAALAAIPDASQRAISTNLWRRSNDFERQNPTLIALAKQSLGMTEAQLDQLFITAATL
jgi:hypothetical protein